MSFKVDWNTLELELFRSWTKDLLTDALNSGKRPNILASDIQIKDLNFGKVAPTFEILEIGELEKDRFRGIFKIKYDGDFHLTLHTKVQANPLKIFSDNSLEREVAITAQHDLTYSFTTPDFVLSNDAFNLPLDLKLSDIKISGIGIIVFSKTKGVTMVFRNDPLDSIKVSSTFDTVQVLANYLQKQIETQIRDLFRETLPTLIHKLSLKYTLMNEDTFNDLRRHKDEEVTSDDDDWQYQHVASGNLSKVAALFSSRETLSLDIPKFKRIIQRSHIDNISKHMVPNLVNSLCANLNLLEELAVPSNNNGIPIDLLLDNDYHKMQNILKEISSIQAQSFHAGNASKKEVRPKPKRRVVRLGRRKTPSSAASLLEPHTPESDTSVVVSTPAPSVPASPAKLALALPMRHPQPVRVAQLPQLKVSAQFSSPSPTASSSVLPGLGLGLNAAPYPISTSPIKHMDPSPRESIVSLTMKEFRRDSESPRVSEKARVKRELRRLDQRFSSLDISHINDKLKYVALDKIDHMPPPPPYQI